MIGAWVRQSGAVKPEHADRGAGFREILLKMNFDIAKSKDVRWGKPATPKEITNKLLAPEHGFAEMAVCACTAADDDNIRDALEDVIRYKAPVFPRKPTRPSWEASVCSSVSYFRL